MKSATLALAAGLALATGCSSASSSSSATQFPITVTGDLGLVRVELDTSSPPSVGTDQLEMTLSRVADGAPLEGMSVSVVPWMPAMDHGTSTPTVTSQGGGKYLVSDLYLFMPGTWELKITFAGPVADHAEPEFQLQ